MTSAMSSPPMHSPAVPRADVTSAIKVLGWSSAQSCAVRSFPRVLMGRLPWRLQPSPLLTLRSRMLIPFKGIFRHALQLRRPSYSLPGLRRASRMLSWPVPSVDTRPVVLLAVRDSPGARRLPYGIPGQKAPQLRSTLSRPNLGLGRPVPPLRPVRGRLLCSA